MYRTTGIRRVALVAVLTTVGIGTASADEMELRPDERSFEETFDPSVNVSGQLLAGLMYPGEPDRVDLDELQVSFALRAGAVGEKVCFRLASRDGVYTAKWMSTLDAPVDGAGSVPVRFTTKHRKTLQGYGLEGLVALASLGRGCDTPDPVYLPTSWGAVPADGPSAVTLFLNTDTSEARVAARFAPDGGIRQEGCRILPSTEVTTTFDTICTLPLTAGDEPLELAVLRQNFSATLPPLRYALQRPR